MPVLERGNNHSLHKQAKFTFILIQNDTRGGTKAEGAEEDILA